MTDGNCPHAVEAGLSLAVAVHAENPGALKRHWGFLVLHRNRFAGKG